MTVTDAHITMHHVCLEPSMLFAQMALTQVIEFRKSFYEQNVRWRMVLGGNKTLDSLADFRVGIEENMRKKVVHHLPREMPNFLNRI